MKKKIFCFSKYYLLIAFKLANQHAQKVLFSCALYTNIN